MVGLPDVAIGLRCSRRPDCRRHAIVAADWPTRPVRLILTLGAGSGTDIGARLLADRLAQRWGQPVIVDNRPGGDGLVAINAFVTAHDDHVLLFAPSSSFTAHPFLHDNLPYKPSDLVPITRVSNTLIAISVPVAMTVASLADLVSLARAQPGKLDWAGVTGAHEFVFAGWLKQLGLNMVEVPYRNPVDAANDLAENRVQVYSSALAIVRPQLLAGKIKLLAVANTVRAPSEPTSPRSRKPAIRRLLSTDWSVCSVRRECRLNCASVSPPIFAPLPIQPSPSG